MTTPDLLPTYSGVALSLLQMAIYLTQISPNSFFANGFGMGRVGSGKLGVGDGVGRRDFDVKGVETIYQHTNWSAAACTLPPTPPPHRVA